jgi:plasmid rolling circle replication initiator protein Rep
MSDCPDAISANSIADPIPLAQVSERDAVWDEHRHNTERVASLYFGTEYTDYARRMQFCSELLTFKLTTEGGLKLSSSRFCRVRFCPVCQWRRSLMWKAKAHQALPNVVEAYPNSRWLFLTLTIRNCPVTELRSTVQQMNRAWTRLTQLKAWPAQGWIKSLEVTRGRDGSAHPHFHVLVMVPSYYFSGKTYISHDKWVQMWQKSLRIDYTPQVSVSAVKKDLQPQQIIPEILKYQTKESDLLADREWLVELTTQLHKTKAVAVGGVLKDYLGDIEQEPEDLIGEGDSPEAVSEVELYFGWRSKVRKYLMQG